jgi:hypothetical protein
LLKLRNGVHLFSRSEKQNGFQQKPGSPKSSSMVAMEGPHEKMAVVFGVSLLLVMIVLPVSVSVNYSASNFASYVDGGPRPPLPPG